MLYQPRTKNPNPVKRVLAPLVGAIAGVVRSNADTGQLDWLRPSELEELGLRRTDQGRYRPFE